MTFQIPRNFTFPTISIPRSLSLPTIRLTRFKPRRKPVNVIAPSQNPEEPPTAIARTKTAWNVAPRIPKFKSLRKVNLPSIQIWRKPVPTAPPVDADASVTERSRAETEQTVRRVMTEATYHTLDIGGEPEADTVSVVSRIDGDDFEGEEIVEAEAVVTHVSKDRLST